MKEFNAAHGKHATAIAEPVRRAMAAYAWPGNVRELRNFIESMVVLDTDGVLGAGRRADGQRGAASGAAAPAPAGGGPANLVGRPLAEVERYYIEKALKLTDGNREEAAKMLGIGERTLYRKIQDWKLQDRIKEALAASGRRPGGGGGGAGDGRGGAGEGDEAAGAGVAVRCAANGRSRQADECRGRKSPLAVSIRRTSL